MMSAGTPPRTPKPYLTLSAGSEFRRQADRTPTVLQWAKCKIQTRMLMVRYSHRLTESEARFAWGDR